MPDYEWLKLLNVYCQTTDSQRKCQINEQTKQGKPQQRHNNKEKLSTDNKLNSEADYFAAVQTWQQAGLKVLQQ